MFAVTSRIRFRRLTQINSDLDGERMMHLDCAYSYVAGGRMIGGFALVAYPARWGASGVMTLIVNHEGIVYQKNLGKATAAIASKMTRFDPDSSWTKAQPYRKRYCSACRRKRDIASRVGRAGERL